MTSFTPVNNTLYLVEQYARMGDIEAIKLVDYSVFKKQTINELCSKLRKYVGSSDLSGVTSDKIIECINYIYMQLDKQFTWETSQFIIYAQCYYNKEGYCIHRIQSKETQNMTLVYCYELAQIAKNEGITIQHCIEELERPKN